MRGNDELQGVEERPMCVFFSSTFWGGGDCPHVAICLVSSFLVCMLCASGFVQKKSRFLIYTTIFKLFSSSSWFWGGGGYEN